MKSQFSFRQLIFVVSALVALVVSTTLEATPSLTSNVGTEIKILRTPGTFTNLIGGRFMHHVSEVFSMGGAAFTGQISNGASGSMSYGGLVGSYSHRLGDPARIELSALIGGAGGFTSGGDVAGGICFEPNLGFNFILGDMVRTALSGGYLWLPNSRSFSGVTAGIRFEFLFSSGNEEHARAEEKPVRVRDAKE